MRGLKPLSFSDPLRGLEGPLFHGREALCDSAERRFFHITEYVPDALRHWRVEVKAKSNVKGNNAAGVRGSHLRFRGHLRG